MLEKLENGKSDVMIDAKKIMDAQDEAINKFISWAVKKGYIDKNSKDEICEQYNLEIFKAREEQRQWMLKCSKELLCVVCGTPGWPFCFIHER